MANTLSFSRNKIENVKGTADVIIRDDDHNIDLYFIIYGDDIFCWYISGAIKLFSVETYYKYTSP